MLGGVFPRAFLRGWQQVGEALHVPDREINNAAAGEESDREDSYATRMGKRMRRGRRHMLEVMTDFYMLFTLTVLTPLQCLMGILMSTTRSTAVSLLSVVEGIDVAMTELLELLEARLQDVLGLWFAIHLCRVHFAELDTQVQRKYMRREMLRVIGGLCFRAVDQFSDPDMLLFVALEEREQAEAKESPENVIEEKEDAIRAAEIGLRVHVCCYDSATCKYFSWLSHACRRDKRKAKRTWCPYILRTERDHAGNRKRVYGVQSRARQWRRQAATYVCATAKQRWLRSSKAFQKSSKRTSRKTWMSFRKKMAVKTTRTV